VYRAVYRVVYGVLPGIGEAFWIRSCCLASFCAFFNACCLRRFSSISPNRLKYLKAISALNILHDYLMNDCCCVILLLIFRFRLMFSHLRLLDVMVRGNCSVFCEQSAVVLCCADEPPTPFDETRNRCS
jgi:hypothetical protein